MELTHTQTHMHARTHEHCKREGHRAHTHPSPWKLPLNRWRFAFFPLLISTAIILLFTISGMSFIYFLCMRTQHGYDWWMDGILSGFFLSLLNGEHKSNTLVLYYFWKCLARIVSEDVIHIFFCFPRKQQTISIAQKNDISSDEIECLFPSKFCSSYFI